MIIVQVARSASNIVVVKLPHVNVKLDPRIIVDESEEMDAKYKFRLSVNGRTLTITRIDADEGWPYFCLRAYLPTEVIPDFTMPTLSGR